jgi:hypothetical protein
MGLLIARALVVLGGILCAALGIVIVVSTPALITGIAFFGVGIAVIVGALIERMRYRSSSHDTYGSPHGPGGGEPTDSPMDPRFQRTDERFVDPTTGTPMRVWIDPASGERRYRAEEGPS